MLMFNKKVNSIFFTWFILSYVFGILSHEVYCPLVGLYIVIR